MLWMSAHEAQGMETQAGMHLSVNPIRRVVTMMQMMQKKIEVEAKNEEQLHEKFMCYCESGSGNLQKDVSEAHANIPQLESAMEEAGAEKSQLKGDIVNHKTDRSEAEKAMAEATAVREKEASEFASYSSEAKTNIAAMAKALAALRSGLAGAFLQTQAADVLRSLLSSDDNQAVQMTDSDRDTLAAFLQRQDSSAPGSYEIVGILEQMKETMDKELVQAVGEEGDSIKGFNGLMAAKKKQYDALTKMIETKTARLGEVGVDLMNLEENLDDTVSSLGEDKKFLIDLGKSCASKKQEWGVRQKTRAEEMLAIADTIKILNDDDALDLFKKTLPSPSLIQMQVTSKEMLLSARAVIKRAKRHRHDVRLDLISMALHGKKVSFDKVLNMIDSMVALLGSEQVADEKKKAQCETDLDESEDEKKVITREVSDLRKNIDDLKASIATFTEDIAGLGSGIVELDKDVSARTAQRKEEHASFVEDLAANNAAEQLLDMAKNRLNKFYNPKMHKEKPARDLSESEQITVNMGGTLAPTAAPGGIAGTGVVALDQQDNDDDDDNESTSFLQAALHRGAPPAPPAVLAAYSKKSEESTGVLSMLDMLKKDVALQTQEMKIAEKDGQSEYEEFIVDAAGKRSADSKSLTEKEAAKADAEASLNSSLEENKQKRTEAMNNDKLIMDLHANCDWLLQNFDVRQEARAGEVDSLKKAKAILSGADYSFVQTATHRHLRTVQHH